MGANFSASRGHITNQARSLKGRGQAKGPARGHGQRPRQAPGVRALAGPLASPRCPGQAPGAGERSWSAPRPGPRGLFPALPAAPKWTCILQLQSKKPLLEGKERRQRETSARKTSREAEGLPPQTQQPGPDATTPPPPTPGGSWESSKSQKQWQQDDQGQGREGEHDGG